MSEEIAECRICFEQETEDDKFISPCMCKGTSKYVHYSCLTTWRNFNRDSEAWNKCMECGEYYTLRYKYPIENTKIFTDIKNPAGIYFFQYIIAISFGSVIWLVDVHNNYLAIKMLNFNQTLPQPSLLDYVKDDELSPQIFYFSYAMFLESMLYYLYFCYKIYKNVNRKKLYFNKIYSCFTFCTLFSFQFIIWYYMLVFNDQPIIFLNVASFISMLEPFIYYTLVKRHRKVILEMNEEYNEEEILSYVENPLLGHDNIFENELELRNIIIEN